MTNFDPFADSPTPERPEPVEGSVGDIPPEQFATLPSFIQDLLRRLVDLGCRVQLREGGIALDPNGVDIDKIQAVLDESSSGVSDVVKAMLAPIKHAHDHERDTDLSREELHEKLVPAFRALEVLYGDEGAVGTDGGLTQLEHAGLTKEDWFEIHRFMLADELDNVAPRKILPLLTEPSFAAAMADYGATLLALGAGFMLLALANGEGEKLIDLVRQRMEALAREQTKEQETDD